MKDLLFALSLGFGGLIWAVQTVEAAPACGPRDRVLAILSDRHGETRRAIGLSADNLVMEVFAAEGGSWTITATLPDGTTCLIALGQHYEAVADGLPARGPRI